MYVKKYVVFLLTCLVSFSFFLEGKNSKARKLRRAIEHGKFEQAIALIQSNEVDIHNNVSQYGDTLLILAAMAGWVEGVDLLIRAEVDLSAQNVDGRTALEEAQMRLDETIEEYNALAGEEYYTLVDANAYATPARIRAEEAYYAEELAKLDYLIGRYRQITIILQNAQADVRPYVLK